MSKRIFINDKDTKLNTEISRYLTDVCGHNVVGTCSNKATIEIYNDEDTDRSNKDECIDLMLSCDIIIFSLSPETVSHVDELLLILRYLQTDEIKSIIVLSSVYTWSSSIPNLNKTGIKNISHISTSSAVDIASQVASATGSNNLTNLNELKPIVGDKSGSSNFSNNKNDNFNDKDSNNDDNSNDDKMKLVENNTTGANDSGVGTSSSNRISSSNSKLKLDDSGNNIDNVEHASNYNSNNNIDEDNNDNFMDDFLNNMASWKFTENDYLYRKPADNYRKCFQIEASILKGCLPKSYKFCILGAGVPYGNEGWAFEALLRKLWLSSYGTISAPYLDDGENILPTIHIDNLLKMMKYLVNIETDFLKPYMLAIDLKQVSLKSIWKTFVEEKSSLIYNETTSTEEFATLLIKDKEVSLLQINLEFDMSESIMAKLDVKTEPEAQLLGLPFHSFRRRLVEEEEERERKNPNSPKFQKPVSYWKCENGITDHIDDIWEEFKKAYNLKTLRISLTGPPCVGKSYYAKMLKDRYHLPILTVDKCVELVLNMSINIPELRAEVQELKESLRSLNAEITNEEIIASLPRKLIASCVKAVLGSAGHKTKGYILDGVISNFYDMRDFFNDCYIAPFDEESGEEQPEPVYTILQNTIPTHPILLDASDEYISECHVEVEDIKTKLAEFRNPTEPVDEVPLSAGGKDKKKGKKPPPKKKAADNMSLPEGGEKFLGTEFKMLSIEPIPSSNDIESDIVESNKSEEDKKGIVDISSKILETTEANWLSSGAIPGVINLYRIDQIFNKTASRGSTARKSANSQLSALSESLRSRKGSSAISTAKNENESSLSASAAGNFIPVNEMSENMEFPEEVSTKEVKGEIFNDLPSSRPTSAKALGKEDLKAVEEIAQYYKDYLMEFVMPTLSKAMLKVAKGGIEDPVVYVSEQLFKVGVHTENQSEARAFFLFKSSLEKARLDYFNNEDDSDDSEGYSDEEY